MGRQSLVPLTPSRQSHELSDLFYRSNAIPKNVGIIRKPLLMTLLGRIDFQITLCTTINRETNDRMKEFIYYLLIGKRTDLNLLEDIIQIIAAKLIGARIPDNYRVGILAAEAIMGPLTQDTLNTFHSAGSKTTVGGGVMGIRSIISDTNSVSQSYINAAPSIRYSSVEELLLRLYKKLSGLNIPGFIVNHILGTIPDNYTFDQMINLLSNTTDGHIYRNDNSFTRNLRKNFLSEPGQSTIIPRRYVRLFLNPELLYMYQLLPSDFANKINQINHIIRKVSFTDIFVAVPGTITNPYIDVFPNSSVIMKMLKMVDNSKQTAADLFFISTTLQNLIRTIYMGGIPNIRINNVNTVKVQSIVWKELFYLQEYYFLISLGLIRKTGIFLDDLVELLDYLDIEYHSIPPEQSPIYSGNNYLALRIIITDYQTWIKLYDHAKSIIDSLREALALRDNQQSAVQMQQIIAILQQMIDLLDDTNNVNIVEKLGQLIDQYNLINEQIKRNNDKWSQPSIKMDDFKLTPYKYISYMVEKAVNKRDRELKEQKDLSLSTWIPVDPLIELSQRFKLDIHGNNILHLLMSGYVSQEVVTTSSLGDTMYIYGIEAVRQLILANIVANMESRNSYIDWRHIALVADRMTYSGTVHGLTYNGQSKDPNSNPFSVLTTERANTLIPANSLFGITDKTSSTATGIIAGVAIPGLSAPPEAVAYANRVLGISDGTNVVSIEGGDVRVPYSDGEAGEDQEFEAADSSNVPITLHDLGINYVKPTELRGILQGNNVPIEQTNGYSNNLYQDSPTEGIANPDINYLNSSKVVSPIRIPSGVGLSSLNSLMQSPSTGLPGLYQSTRTDKTGSNLSNLILPVFPPQEAVPTIIHKPDYTDSSLPNLVSPGEMFGKYDAVYDIDDYVGKVFDGPFNILTMYLNFI